MRDLFFLVLFPAFIFYGFKAPIVSLCLWLWTSLYPLQNWLYGIGLALRFNLTFSLVTIFSYIFMKNKPEFRTTSLFVLIIIFFLHSSLGVAINGYDYQWNSFENFFKGIVFFVMTTLILRKREHFEAVLAFVVLSLCVYGATEGLKYISSGGGHSVRGILGPLGDNNKVALGLNMCLPIILYLVNQFEHKIIKYGLRSIFVLCILAVLGTASRGGFVALAFFLVYFWWSNGRKLSYIFPLIIIVGLASQLVPDSWYERMNTLKHTEESGSLDHRVTFWKVNLLAGLDHPMVGVGFDGTANIMTWHQYKYDLDSINFFIYTPPPEKGFVAHSIYFETMGNQGVLGFLIFLLILLLYFLKINQLRKYYTTDDWQYHLLTAMKVSVAVYCIGGAALNGAYFELLYLNFAIVICLDIAHLTAGKMTVKVRK